VSSVGPAALASMENPLLPRGRSIGSTSRGPMSVNLAGKRASSTRRGFGMFNSGSDKKQSKMDNFLEPEGPIIVMNEVKSQEGNIPNTQSTH